MLTVSLSRDRSSSFETKTRYLCLHQQKKKNGNMWRPSALSSNEKKSHSDAAESVCVCIFQQDRLKVNSPESSFELIEGCTYTDC